MKKEILEAMMRRASKVSENSESDSEEDNAEDLEESGSSADEDGGEFCQEVSDQRDIRHSPNAN